MAVGTETDNGGTGIINLKDRAAWKAALGTANRPVLAHLNADTTWLLQLPIPSSASSSSSQDIIKNTNKKSSSSSSRSRYNILIDPWLQGPQSDVAAWFSTQWHVVAPTVQTMQELEELLAELEGEEEEGNEQDGSGGEVASHVDCVVISHEFTDHCHQATLLELPKGVPVVATEKAADLIRSWQHFETVLTTPGFSASTSTSWRDALAVEGRTVLPPWVGIGRVITQGNALYYHSAVLIVFDLGSGGGGRGPSAAAAAEAVVYSPHGIKGTDLAPVRAAGIQTLALLHGLHDVRIWLTAQLNLGALNGVQAVRASGARYWVATHDEAKRGGGFISWLLRRTTYSLRDAVEADRQQQQQAKGSEDEDEDEAGPGYEFVELGSGDGMLLAQS